MNIFDKTEKDFDEEGILRAVEPEPRESHPGEQILKPTTEYCECVWDVTTNDFMSLCDNHKMHISNIQNTVTVVQLYRAISCEGDEVYVVAEEFNEAVEMAEIYFDEEDDEELREIKLAHNALVRR